MPSYTQGLILLLAHERDLLFLNHLIPEWVAILLDHMETENVACSAIKATRVSVRRGLLNALITGTHNHSTQLLGTRITLVSTRMVFSDPK